MFARLLPGKCAQHVADAFDWMWRTLGDGTFRRLFPAVLKDNGAVGGRRPLPHALREVRLRARRGGRAEARYRPGPAQGGDAPPGAPGGEVARRPDGPGQIRVARPQEKAARPDRPSPLPTYFFNRQKVFHAKHSDYRALRPSPRITNEMQSSDHQEPPPIPDSNPITRTLPLGSDTRSRKKLVERELISYSAFP